MISNHGNDLSVASQLLYYIIYLQHNINVALWKMISYQKLRPFYR